MFPPTFPLLSSSCRSFSLGTGRLKPPHRELPDILDHIVGLLAHMRTQKRKERFLSLADYKLGMPSLSDLALIILYSLLCFSVACNNQVVRSSPEKEKFLL